MTTTKWGITPTIAAATLAAGILFAADAKADGRAERVTRHHVEAAAGQRQMDLEVRMERPIGDDAQLEIVTRGTFEYLRNEEGDFSYFGLVDASHTIIPHLDISGELQLRTGFGPSPRLGATSRYTLGPTQGYTTLSIGIISIASREDMITAQVRTALEFRPRLGEHISGYSRLDASTTVGYDGHELSEERLRLGVQWYRAVGGVALDLDEQGNAPDVSYNLGLFLGADF